MEVQEKMEREVSLKELFWNILFAWRKLICFGVVFAVLLCGMKYLLDLRSDSAASAPDLEQLEDELSEDELRQVIEARNLKERIEEYEQYLETSVLMQLDPYKRQVLELQYYVETDYTFNYTQDTERDYTSDLMSLYYNYIMSGEMSKNVIADAELSQSQANISELWSVAQAGTSISIKITCPEEKKMDAIAKSIKEQLSTKETEYQSVGEHKLKLLGESKNVVVDTALSDRKNTISNNIVTLNTQLNNLKANMSDLQLSILDSGQDEAEDEKEQEISMKPGISFKYLAAGCVLGIFLVCAWITCTMIFTAKLQNPEEIRTLYGVRLLGEVAAENGRKRFLSVIDDKLLTIKNRRRKTLSAQQQMKVIAASAALSCRQRGIERVYLTGSEYEKIDARTLELLKNELRAQKLKIEEGANIYYDAHSLERGTEIGNMLFVEQKGQSIYDEIYNELNLAKEQKNYIMGIVVLV